MLLVNRSKQNNPSSKSSASPPPQANTVPASRSKQLLYNSTQHDHNNFPSSGLPSAPTASPAVTSATISPHVSTIPNQVTSTATSTENASERKTASRFNFSGIFKKFGNSSTASSVPRSSTIVSAESVVSAVAAASNVISKTESNKSNEYKKSTTIPDESDPEGVRQHRNTFPTHESNSYNHNPHRPSASISIPSDDDACLEICFDEDIEEEPTTEDIDEEDEVDDDEYNSEIYPSMINRRTTGASIRPSLSASTTNTLIQKISGVSLISATPTPTPPPANMEFHPSVVVPGLLTTAASSSLSIAHDRKESTTTPTEHNVVHDANLLFAPNLTDRYNNFTSECISLQNSEMTSTFSADIDDGNGKNASTTVSLNSQIPTSPKVLSYTPPPLVTADSGATITPLRTPDNDKPAKKQNSRRRTLRNILRYGNYIKKQDPSESEKMNVITPGYASNSDTPDIFQEIDNSEDDPTTYLLDTESDLNYDPNQEESVHDYKKGGYHPVTKGEVYYSSKLPNREYIILQKLGWGHFSTVWLAKSRYNPNLENPGTTEGADSISELELLPSINRSRSHHSRGHILRHSRHVSATENYLDDNSYPGSIKAGDTQEHYVAIKFVKSHKTYREAAEDEIRILRTLDTPLKCPPDKKFLEHYDSYFGKFKFNLQSQPISHEGYDHIMKLLDDFQVNGPNGSHICMVFEVLGENMLHFLYKYKSLYKHGIRSGPDLHKFQLGLESHHPRHSCQLSGCQCSSSNNNFPPISESIDSGTSKPCSCCNTTDQQALNSQPQQKKPSYANLFREQLMFVKPQLKSKKLSSTISKLSLGLLTHHNDAAEKEEPELPKESPVENKLPTIIATPTSAEQSPEIDPIASKPFTPSFHETLDLNKLHQENLLKLYGDLQSHGGLPLSLAKSIVKQILKALDYMHHCGVIHTDLKPENILIEIKDINRLIKYFEYEKLSKMKQFFTTHSLDVPTTPKNSSLKKSSVSRARGSSVASSCSLVAGSYKKSKNSIVSKFDSPIRCSKPLFSVSTDNLYFKDVSSTGTPKVAPTSSIRSPSISTSSYTTASGLPSSSNSSYVSASTPLQTIPSVNGSISSANLASAAPLRSPSFVKTIRKQSVAGGKGVSPKAFSLLNEGYDSRRSPFVKRLSSASSLSTLNSNNSTKAATTGLDFSLGPPALPTSASVSVTSVPQLTTDDIFVKIADLGNATYSHSHFTNQIQTRQYRAPETILRHNSWGASTDMWSLGCIIFELITGDYLFDPHNGTHFDKDEDHLAQIIELLGEFPPDEFLIDCYYTTKYFKLDDNNKQHQVVLKNISSLKIWKLKDVLVEKYKFDPEDEELELIADLILKCLRYNAEDRYDAHSLLKHPWFTGEALTVELTNDHDDIPGYSECYKGDDDEVDDEVDEEEEEEEQAYGAAED